MNKQSKLYQIIKQKKGEKQMGEKFTEQNVFSISDATIAVVSANTSSTYTQGKKIRVPELQSMDVTMTKETKDATYGAGKKAAGI